MQKYDVTVYFGTRGEVDTDEVRVLVGIPASSHQDALSKAREYYQLTQTKQIKGLSSGIQIEKIDRWKELRS